MSSSSWHHYQHMISTRLNQKYHNQWRKRGRRRKLKLNALTEIRVFPFIVIISTLSIVRNVQCLVVVLHGPSAQRHSRVQLLSLASSTRVDVDAEMNNSLTSNNQPSLLNCLKSTDDCCNAFEPSASSTESTSSRSTSRHYHQPSRSYQPRVLQKVFRTIEWCPVSSMLPLQYYHVKRTTPHAADTERQYRANNDQMTKMMTIAPDLESVLRNPSSYNLSKSSQVLVDDYIATHSNGIKDNERQRVHQQQLKEDSDRLWNKLNAEYRASQPLSKEVLEILYQDEHMVVVNKPSGVLSVPGPRRNPSLAQVVYDVIRPINVELDQTIVHRLDMATSGIMIYALSLDALSRLHYAFKNRHVQKTYQALVEGHLDPTQHEGEIDVHLERDPNNPPFMRVARPRNNNGMADMYATEDANEDKRNNKVIETPKFFREAPKPSFTTWKVLSREHLDDGQPVTRLELRPWTGRTHQLRVHTSEVLMMPIVGDDIYGSAATRRVKVVKKWMDRAQTQDDEKDEEEKPREKSLSDYGCYEDDSDNNNNKDDDEQRPLCLHAQRLCIRHPISGASMIFEADPPF